MRTIGKVVCPSLVALALAVSALSCTQSSAPDTDQSAPAPEGAAQQSEPTPAAEPAATETSVEDTAKPSATAYPLATCVVSGEELGKMGEPVVYDHKGREVRFCCKGCIKKFEAEPDQFLAKLDEAVKQ